MRVLITGTSRGIGRATAEKFLKQGHSVFGIDIEASAINSSNYEHYCADVRFPAQFPDIEDTEILVNNAGVQLMCMDDIDINLKGMIYVTQKYGLQKNIKSIVNMASTSAHNGAEFPEYAASKGGVLAYTKNIAQSVAQWGATCNSISPGGVLTESNQHIISDSKLLEAVYNETLLGKWAAVEEIAEWIYFMSVINKSMTGQDIIIDNGELAKFNFIW